MEPLGKSAWQFFSKMGINLPQGPDRSRVVILGHVFAGNLILPQRHSTMFLAALFLMARNSE